MQTSILDKYIELTFQAGRLKTIDELWSFSNENAIAIQNGQQAILTDLKNNKITIEEAFTSLDYLKSIIATQLTQRRGLQPTGKDYDLIISRPNPGGLSYYLKSKHKDVAVMAFHVLSHDKIMIMVARYPNGKNINGIRGFGDIYYNALYLDGLKDEVYKSISNYQLSLTHHKPDFNCLKDAFEFFGTSVFLLLCNPVPPEELIFIPHRLFNLLPLHAIFVEINGERLYLNDKINSISYASSIQELIYAGTNLSGSPKPANNDQNPHFLYVFDNNINLPFQKYEKMWYSLFRSQLEPQGVGFDLIEKYHMLPKDFSKYSWISWSSHAYSDNSDWRHNYLEFEKNKIESIEILKNWTLPKHPVVVLAACETALDTSCDPLNTEYIGLDLIFRIAGARATIASLWQIEDILAGFSSMLLPAWFLKGGMPPAMALTLLQRYFRLCKWKDFLFNKEQLATLPTGISAQVSELQSPLWDLPDNYFADDECWAALKCNGR